MTLNLSTFFFLFLAELSVQALGKSDIPLLKVSSLYLYTRILVSLLLGMGPIYVSYRGKKVVERKER
jgi:hypothetical protein